MAVLVLRMMAHLFLADQVLNSEERQFLSLILRIEQVDLDSLQELRSSSPGLSHVCQQWLRICSLSMATLMMVPIEWGNV